MEIEMEMETTERGTVRWEEIRGSAQPIGDDQHTRLHGVGGERKSQTTGVRECELRILFPKSVVCRRLPSSAVVCHRLLSTRVYTYRRNGGGGRRRGRQRRRRRKRRDERTQSTENRVAIDTQQLGGDAGGGQKWK